MVSCPIRTAIDETETALGTDDLSLVPLPNGLGIVSKYTVQFDCAEQVYWRAVALAERQRPTDALQLADLYHNLGGLEHARGRHAEGELLARRAVELRELALGNEHPAVAADRAALAAILDALGESDEAEALLREALRVLEHTVGCTGGPVRFIHMQGLTDRPLEVSELFAPITLDEYRIRARPVRPQ